MAAAAGAAIGVGLGVAGAAGAAQVACADGDCTNELGQLTQVAKGTYQSSGGLTYDPGRVQHVLQHTQDNFSKPLHGVFTGTSSEVFSLIDEAWIEVQNVSSSVVGYEAGATGSSTGFVVDMGKIIGYVGGSSGSAMGNPSTSLLQVVLNGSKVITAYPVLTP